MWTNMPDEIFDFVFVGEYVRAHARVWVSVRDVGFCGRVSIKYDHSPLWTKRQ